MLTKRQDQVDRDPDSQPMVGRRSSNSASIGRYNERLVLDTIRRWGGASKADVARLTGLSPQAAVRIVDNLEASSRVLRMGKRTGGIGQPAIIFEINGDSGCTVGVEIGRDRITCLLLDFGGAILSRSSKAVVFPEPDAVIPYAVAFATRELNALPRQQREGFLGFGIAMPWFIREWREELGLPAEQSRAWTAPGIMDRFRDGMNAPVYFQNDGNAGALAELFCGAGHHIRNFLYIHIGKFVGGGLILNAQLHVGQNGNAGAMASIPVPGNNGVEVLLHQASTYTIESGFGNSLESVKVSTWLKECVEALSFTCISRNSLLDLEAIIIGGTLPEQIINDIVSGVHEKIEADAPKDFFKPAIIPGANNYYAPARGAGLLPLISTFSPDVDTLIKGTLP